MSLREDAAELQPELAALRRELHQIPEIGLDLPRTQERVLAALHPLPLEVSTGTGLSSITAVLRGGKPGPVVLLRGDMDALPVTERHGRGVHVPTTTARCTPADTTCTPPGSSVRPGCWPRGARISPATSCSCSSRARRAGTAPAT